MNKELLHQVIIKALIDKHDIAYQATETAMKSATDKENIPEHKYDTLSLEAAYLAHGQAQRVEQSLQDLQRFKALPVKTYSERHEIDLGAYIELLDVEREIVKWFFLSPVAGGLTVEFDGRTVQLLTKESPLGKRLYRKQVGDEVELNIGGKNTCYEIVTVF
ncbi:GreA/GreB family elongation factor [Vibrio gangliei]|uniref:GreA/GreB family elongation factor n=1 Tax=Vibrio gangliei TaxID=2077090 RepID=UPI000D016672|nr:GreA/GreB family elongation factor [Vibrio gangliei]